MAGFQEAAVHQLLSPGNRLERWEHVETALTNHHKGPDLEAARAVCACVAAHRLTGAPVWPMLVAPPGSMKTHLLGGFKDLPGFNFIDQVTPQTFISGQIEDPLQPSKIPASLLNRIGAEGIIVYPDFSTVLAMKQEAKASVLADMRRIYDGELRKEFGTAQQKESRSWKGRITFVVAVTPAIDAHYGIFQTLGERFVMIRWPRAGGIEAALAAMDQDNAVAKGDLNAAIHGLFNNLPSSEPKLPHGLKVQIAALTEVAVRGRTHLSREGSKKEIIYVPEAESATRLAQQLAQMAKGSALLMGRVLANEDDIRLVRRAAFDCIPPARSKILQTLIAGGKTYDVKLPKSTLCYAKEELQAQELMEGEYLSPFARDMLEQAGVIPPPTRQ
jgi:hypothetical protein